MEQRCARREAPANPKLPRLAPEAIGRHIHLAVVGLVSARIRLSLRINIPLIIGEIYKMVEDFSTSFNLLYLPMKYLAIISRYPVYITKFYFTQFFLQIF